jgi:hypothetical protein
VIGDCAVCERALGPDSGPMAGGLVRHKGRGLCSRCYTVVRRAGQLHEYPLARRARSEALLAEVVFLRDVGVTHPADVAARLGVSRRTVERYRAAVAA